MRWKRLFLGTLLILLPGLVLGFSGCSREEDPWKGQGGPPRVLVSFPPLYSFAKSVAGDDAAVLCLMTSQGPHDHEADHGDIIKFHKADLFFMNGLQLEKKGLVSRLKQNSGNKKVQVIELGTALSKDSLLSFQHAEVIGKEEEHEDHGQYDPHVWLGIDEAKEMVQKICEELSHVDRAHAKGYEERAKKYLLELDKLQQEGQSAFAAKTNKQFLAMHESLRYFARSFQLNMVDSIQPRPGVEADGSKLAQLVKVCLKDKDKPVRVIAVEPQYQEGKAKVLIEELRKRGVKDATTVTIDPLETVTGKLDKDFYIRMMRKNIANLRKALK